jgi:hypothetical protein
LIVLIVAAFFVLGAQLAARTHPPDDLSPLERAASAALLGSCIWIAVNWLLSVPHWLDRPALVVAGVVAAIAAFVLRRSRAAPAAMPAWWPALLPLGAWLAFLLWRAWLLPAGSADALIYHMPRALLLWRAGGYAWVPGAPDVRINGVAANYELLLADVLAVQRADTLAEWTSILFFVLFVLAAMALARRWWGESRALAAVPYLVAAIPIVVLHAGAIKNDLMSQFFALSALLWGGRWWTTRRFADAALCVAALFAGFGTKNHLLLLIALFGIVFLLRGRSLRFFLRLGAVAVAAALLLGSVHYVAAMRRSGGEGVAPAQYGEWRNLWLFPLEIFAAPFSSDPTAIGLPGFNIAMPWYRYDLYASHYGQPVTIALLALPFLLWRYRRGGAVPASERHLALTIGAAFFLLMMPLRAVPAGFAAPFSRYLLCVAVLILCATIVPLLAEIDKAVSRTAGALLLGTIAIVSLSAIANYAANDKWMPLEYVKNVARSADHRIYPPMPVRAAFIVDHVAGAADRVDVHGDHDTYLYPAYGEELSRDVAFIAAPSQIRPIAQWVIVDRADNVFWHHSGFKSAADWSRYWGRGTPSAADLAVVEALRHDPRFQLVFEEPRLNQAVFRRIH